MSDQHIVAASAQIVYIWQYTSKLKNNSADSAISQLRRKDGRERQFHIDDIPSSVMCDTSQLMERGQTNDPVCSHSCKCELSSAPQVCALGISENVALVARQSGMVHRYSLPHVALEGKFSLNCHASILKVNCDSTRLACIDINGLLTLWSFVASDQNQQAKNTCEKLALERKDCWDLLWSVDEPEMFAMLEKVTHSSQTYGQ